MTIKIKGKLRNVNIELESLEGHCIINKNYIIKNKNYREYFYFERKSCGIRLCQADLVVIIANRRKKK